MFSAQKFVLQTRTLCTSCISRLFEHPHHLKTTKWPVISRQTKHPNWHKPPVSTRCLKVKAGKFDSLQPQYKRDKVPTSFTLVYVSGLKNYIHGFYLGVALLCVSSGVVVAIRWRNLMKNLTGLDSIYLMGVMSLSAIVFSIAYRFARKVIIRIYLDADASQFVAVRRTCLGRLKQIVYYPREVKLKHTGKLTNQDLKEGADIKINGQDYYISASGFSAPIYYNIHLSGEDLPKDFSKSLVSDIKF